MQKKDPEILYEDASLIVCVKPAGIASQGSGGFQTDLCDLLKLHMKKQTKTNGEPYLGVVHRLDQAAGGVMVYAKNPQSAAILSAQVAPALADSMKKRYYAVLEGRPAKSEGILRDYLFRDGRANKSYVAEKGQNSQREVKLAELSYRLLKELESGEQTLWLAEIELKTGRHHQIRVQFSHAGCPLYGDRRYHPASKGKELALFSHYLEFTHPKTKQRMTFDRNPSEGIFSFFFKAQAGRARQKP